MLVTLVSGSCSCICLRIWFFMRESSLCHAGCATLTNKQPSLMYRIRECLEIMGPTIFNHCWCRATVFCRGSCSGPANFFLRRLPIEEKDCLCVLFKNMYQTMSPRLTV